MKKTLPAWLAVLAAFALVARCWAPRLDVASERTAVDSKVCSQSSLDAVRTTLTELGFDYLIDDSRTRLQATHFYTPQKLIRPAITIELTFNTSGAMKSCKVVAKYVDR
jgi:hypothetical protein